jgi:hypothetical protein
LRDNSLIVNEDKDMKLLTLLIIVFMISTGFATTSVSFWLGCIVLGCWIAD